MVGVSQGLVHIVADVPGTTRSLAGFGELTYSLSDHLRLTGGLRYSVDRRTQSGFFSVTALVAPPPAPPVNATYRVGGDTTFYSLSYRAGTAADIAAHSIVYATVSSGFKAGDFNGVGAQRVRVGKTDRFHDQIEKPVL